MKSWARHLLWALAIALDGMAVLWGMLTLGLASSLLQGVIGFGLIWCGLVFMWGAVSYPPSARES